MNIHIKTGLQDFGTRLPHGNHSIIKALNASASKKFKL